MNTRYLTSCSFLVVATSFVLGCGLGSSEPDTESEDTSPELSSELTGLRELLTEEGFDVTTVAAEDLPSSEPSAARKRLPDMVTPEEGLAVALDGGEGFIYRYTTAKRASAGSVGVLVSAAVEDERPFGGLDRGVGGCGRNVYFTDAEVGTAGGSDWKMLTRDYLIEVDPTCDSVFKVIE